jgi:hypothetical protein
MSSSDDESDTPPPEAPAELVELAESADAGDEKDEVVQTEDAPASGGSPDPDETKDDGSSTPQEPVEDSSAAPEEDQPKAATPEPTVLICCICGNKPRTDKYRCAICNKVRHSKCGEQVEMEIDGKVVWAKICTPCKQESDK